MGGGGLGVSGGFRGLKDESGEMHSGWSGL